MEEDKFERDEAEQLDKVSENDIILRLEFQNELRPLIFNQVMKAAVRNFRNTLVLTALNVAIEQHSTISYLMSSSGYETGASSLVRPLLDSSYRCAWLATIAQPEELLAVTDHTDDHSFPKTSEIARVMDKHSGTTMYAKGIEQLTMLHDFTHMGNQQLSRHLIDETTIGANYTRRDRYSMLTSSDFNLTLAACAAADLFGVKGIAAAMNDLAALLPPLGS